MSGGTLVVAWRPLQSSFLIDIRLSLEIRCLIAVTVRQGDLASVPQRICIGKKEIAGFDARGVEYYFSQYPSVKEVEVKFSPFWVKSIPALADRIEIEVK